jgi:hypothetical protein
MASLKIRKERLEFQVFQNNETGDFFSRLIASGIIILSLMFYFFT